MTYYEWINYLNSLKYIPISDNPINIINNSNIEYKGNIKIRFLNHIVALINFRLNYALDNFLLKEKIINQNKDNLSIELNDLKNEIIFAKKLASIKYFDENIKNELLTNIDNFSDEMAQSIKDSYINCNNNEILLLINNLNLKS